MTQLEALRKINLKLVEFYQQGITPKKIFLPSNIFIQMYGKKPETPPKFGSYPVYLNEKSEEIIIK